MPEWLILFIEENCHDEVVAVAALEKNNLFNTAVLEDDGVKAIDSVFTGFF